MKKFHRLTLGERYQIQSLLDSGQSLRFIAGQLGRNPSTICRELRKKPGSYRALESDAWTEWVRRLPHPELQKITGSLKRYVRKKICLDWSPEQIAGEWQQKTGEKVVSHQTIYRYLEREKEKGSKLWQHLRILRKQRKDRKKPHWRPMWSVPNRTMIWERPKRVEKRNRIGDFERDTMLGKRNGSLLLTCVDRTSRLLKMKLLTKALSLNIHKATVELLKNEPVQTITNDNSMEFARHELTAQELGATIYFSRSYASWERGTNENTNGLLRQYFPRKKEIGRPTKKRIKQIEDLINNRPRKCLGYQTPRKVHDTLKRQALR